MRPLFGIAVSLLCLLAAVPARAAEHGLYGFDRQGIARELSLEQTYLTLPSSQEAASFVSSLNGYSRFDGGWGDGEAARWMAGQLSSFGWEVRLAAYTAPLEAPKRVSLELLAPQNVRFDLHEAADPSDPDVTGPDVGLPFDYGSADGNIRAPLVYANRGTADDFAVLARAGVEMRGAIALIRLGALDPGTLAPRAQTAGACGVVFYPDPSGDGAGRGTALPDGPWRPLGSARRDALITRRPLAIPVLPVTPTVAQALLAAIPGGDAPPAWRGGLPVPYHLGRGGLAHLAVLLDRRKGQLTNVVAMLPGRKADIAVVLGAHRDAWAHGAADNASGIATLMEVARGLGYLYRSGWRPQRTIAIVGLDGGEIGELGSYAFAFGRELQGRIAAFVDCDACVTGSHFEAGAFAPLSALVREGAGIVPDGGGTMLSQHWNGSVALPTARDGTVFAYALGVPTLDVKFPGPCGIDGSAYDDARWMTQFGDPGYVHHRELAQLIGTIALRLADASSLPMQWSAYDAPLDTSLRHLSLEVKRTDLPIDLQDLHAAVRAFETSAAQADARIATGSMPDARQLDAADALLACDGHGPFDVIYSEPLAAGDEGRIEWRIQMAAAALRRAASLLSPSS